MPGSSFRVGNRTPASAATLGPASPCSTPGRRTALTFRAVSTMRKRGPSGAGPSSSCWRPSRTSSQRSANLRLTIIAGGTRNRSGPTRSRPAGPSSISNSPRPATAASVPSKGRYANDAGAAQSTTTPASTHRCTRPPRSGDLGLLQRRGERARQVFGATHAPVVQEEHPRLLVRHVLVDGDDVDAAGAQRLEHLLQLALDHGEVAIDNRAIVGPGERGPGVHAHRIAHRLAGHLDLAPDGDLVDALVHLAAAPESGVDALRIEVAIRRIDVARGHGTLLLEHGEHLRHALGELLLVAHPADVHEHDPRALPEEMIVQRGHL